MTERRNAWRIALLTAPAIVLAGSLSGYLSNSGYSNGWFAGLTKPWFMPPGWLFGVAWTTLYTLLGVAVALILAQPEAPRRRTALAFFLAQLVLNFAWSPVFFGARMIDAAFLVVLLMLVVAGISAVLFFCIRPLAGYLMLPYLAWLCLATALTFEIGRLNPGADAAPLGILGG